MGRGAHALRALALALSLGVLGACQQTREPAAPAARPPAAQPASPSAPVATWALLEPADDALGAAGKPAPARRGQPPRVDTPSTAAAGADAPPLPAPAPIVPAKPVTATLPRHVPPRLPDSARYAPRPPAGGLAAHLYDAANPDMALLQRPADALAGLPVDSRGEVDWVRALDERLIRPRAAVRDDGRMQVLDTQIVMRGTAAMPWVLFPHRPHTQWLACENCHPVPFAARAGGNEMRMDDLFRGRWCGQCHDRVAFPMLTCERCHNVLHPDSPRAWWETGGTP